MIEVAADLKPVLVEVRSELGALGQPSEAQLRAISTAQASLRNMLFVAVAPLVPARTCTSMLIDLVGLVRRQRETDSRITGAPWWPPQSSGPRPAWQVGHDKIEEMLRNLEQQCQKISAKHGPFAQDPLSRAVARLRDSFGEWRMAWALCDSSDTASLDSRIAEVEANWVSLAGEFASYEVPHFDPTTEEGTKDSLSSLALSTDVLLLTKVRPEAAERLWQRALRLRQEKPHLPSLPPGTGDPKQIVLSLKDWVVSAQGTQWERRHERSRRDSEQPNAEPTPSPVTDLAEIAKTLRAMMGVPRTHSVYETAGSLLINATQQGGLDGLPEAAKLIRVHAARPGGQNLVGAWSDGLFEIRKQRGLRKSVYFQSFDEDLVLVAGLIEEGLAPHPPHDQVPGMRAETRPPKVPRTKADVEREIQLRKARFGNYRKLVDQVVIGDRKACATARKIFGRNRLAHHLGCSKPLVTETPLWQEVSAELQLGRRTSATRTRRDRAVEDTPASTPSAPDEAAEREMRTLLSRVPADQAEAVRHQLEAGRMNRSQALESLRLAANPDLPPG
ncbi:MAG: hypothetical protein AB7O77_17245 [Phycisphaerales bacterium]